MLVALLSTGCDVDPKACERQTDCFAFEVCRDGLCQAQPRPDAGNDAAPPIDCRVAGTDCGFLVCNELTGQCEDCLTDSQCDANEICDRGNGRCTCAAEAHLCGSQCVNDDDPATCGERCEPCPTPPNALATCESETCGFQCQEGWFRCDGPDCAAECQECVIDSDCGPEAPVCNGGSCTDCSSSDDCQRFAPENGVCNVVSGRCVECTTNERESCEGRACNTLEGRCTDDLERSVQTCNPCQADTACHEGEACVRIEFNGIEFEDGRCLILAADAEDCRRPYPLVRTYETVDGVEDEFCSFRTDNTTCQGILDYETPCSIDADCGLSNFSDAVCRDFPGMGDDERCTYRCNTDNDCGLDATCIGGLYCVYPF